jgi:gluconolactonase
MKRISFLLILLSIVALSYPRARAQEDWSFVAWLNPALDDILPADVKVERVADGFGLTEGPVWVRKGGYLLFSDIPANVIHKYDPKDGKVSIFLKYSGFTGDNDLDVGRQSNNGRILVTSLGSNGITLDPQGRVVFCAHGDRAVIRLDTDGRRTVLADRFEGKRFNSPNDLVYKSDGSLYFSDPDGGLRFGDQDPKKELSFYGLFLLKDGKVQALVKDMAVPNGLGFSPDEKYFYVDDTGKKIIWRYEVQPDDTLANGHIFMDMTDDKAPGVPDGMKIDSKGNIYSTGPGGIWIISPSGKHLGTILMPNVPANLAFGGADGKTLYIAAHTVLYRVQLKIAGVPPGPKS